MGRYYSRHGENLYIYVTSGEELLDLKLFPSELNLFESESSWRFNNKMAIVNEAEDISLDKAEIILSINGFKRRDYEERLLENYYKSGDEDLLLNLRYDEAKQEHVVESEKVQIEDIIIPDIIKPGPVETSPIKVEYPTPKKVTTQLMDDIKIKIQRPLDEGQLIRYIMGYINSRGFLYQSRLIKNYYVSLKTKPFVILMGYSGMGKTSLTRLIAEAITEDVEEQYLRIAVQHDWMDERNLMGFYDHSTDRYISKPFLNFILKALENPDKPYFICLDDMNLSNIENYLSSFLSALESLEREIILHGLKGGTETEDGRYVPLKIKVPENLFITGTIDTDQPTNPPSKRLLDRMNSIEFSEVELRGILEAKEFRESMVLDMGTLKSFRKRLTPSEEQRVLKVLVEINKRTTENGAPISQRMRREILDYIANSIGVFSWNSERNLRTALDLQLKQRVLAKIRGKDSIRPLLEELSTYFEEQSLKISAEKTDRMLDRLERFGYTGFY